MAASRDEIIESLAIELGGDVAQLLVALQDAEKATKDSVGKQVSAWNDLKKIVSDSGKALGTFAKEQSRAMALSLLAMTRQAIDAADELGKMSQRTGISVEALSTLDLAAKTSNTSLAELEVGVRNVARNLEESAKPGGKFRATLHDIGVDLEALKTQTPDQQLLTLADAFAKLKDDGTKTVAVMEVFGPKVGPKLIPFLSQGAKGIKELQEQARDMGLEISTETSRQAAVFNDTLTVLEERSKATGRTIATAILPEVNELLGAFERGARTGGILGGAIEAAGAAWDDFAALGKKALLAVELAAINMAVSLIQSLHLEGQFESFIAGQRSRVEKIRAENQALVDAQRTKDEKRTAEAQKSAEDAAKRTALISTAGAQDEADKNRERREASAISSLEQKIQGARQLNDLGKEATNLETARAAIESGSFQDFSKGQKAKLLLLSEQLDKLEAIQAASAQKTQEVGQLQELRDQLAVLQALSDTEKNRVETQQAARAFQDDGRRAEFENLSSQLFLEQQRQAAAEAAKQSEQERKDQAAELLASLETNEQKRAKELEDIRALALVNEEVRAREGELIAATNKKFDELKDHGTEAMKSIKSEGEVASESLQSSFQELLLDPLNKGFDDLAKNFIKALAQMEAQKIASGIFGKGGALGGVLGLAGGGPVVGPGTSTSDSIDARLSAGEFVQPAAAVRHYGLAFMELIRRRTLSRYDIAELLSARRFMGVAPFTPRVPNFAEGGAVVGAERATQAKASLDLTIVNAFDKQTVLEVLATRSAGDVVFNHMASRKRELSGLLG